MGHLGGSPPITMVGLTNLMGGLQGLNGMPNMQNFTHSMDGSTSGNNPKNFGS